MIIDSFSLGLLLVQWMGWLLRGKLNRAGWKVHRAPALPLASLEGLAVEEAGDASRKTQVLPCWFLPETSCKAALLPGSIVVHALALCVQLKTQIRFTDVLSVHHGRSLTKMLSVRPFKLRIHILRKF